MKLFSAIVRSFVKNLGNFGSGMVGVPIAGDIVLDAWDNWHKDTDPKKMRAEIEAYAGQSVQEALGEAQKAVAAEAPDLPAETQKQIIDYVSLVPASIRRSLRRPTDHTGLTAPPGLALRAANDLLPFLPAKMPRFKAGDQPLPNTDLELIELVGQGGFGEVWKARHLDRPKAPLVALKFCLDAAAAKSLENERTLLDQIASAGKIDGIVQLHYTHLRATPPCLEYEFVEGGDLTSLIAELHQKGNPNPDFVARILQQLAQTVALAHQLKPSIIHRDLKPANILVRRIDKKLTFKIADFGIGALAAKKALLDYTTGKTKMAQKQMETIEGAYTPFYASPEQVSGNLADPRDDVHALGVIWYQLQTGNLSLMTLPSHWRQDLLDAGMPEGHVSILTACIGRQADRPVNAGDLAQRLIELLAPPLVAEVVPDDDERPRRHPRREPEVLFVRRDEEEYDRPRKPAGGNTGLIIGLVIGGVLLIGGGITAAIMLSGGSTPTKTAKELIIGKWYPEWSMKGTPRSRPILEFTPDGKWEFSLGGDFKDIKEGTYKFIGTSEINLGSGERTILKLTKNVLITKDLDGNVEEFTRVTGTDQVEVGGPTPAKTAEEKEE